MNIDNIKVRIEKITCDVHNKRVFFPIKDLNETASLEYVSYTLDTPKYDVIDCRQRGMTFAAPIRIKVRLVVWDVHPETKARTIRDVKEKEVYFGEIPLMTEHGTFIVNGTERVIVSQLHRSPGVFFEYDKKKAILGGRILFSARIIPVRGSWLDFEFDHKDLMYVRIDRRKKFPVSTLLRALGYTTEQLLSHFYQSEIIVSDGKKFSKKIEPDLLRFQQAQRDIVDPKTDETIVKKGKRFLQPSIDRMKEAGIKTLSVSSEELKGRVVASDVISPATGEVLVACNEPLTDETIEKILSNSVKEFPVIYFDTLNVSSCIRDTISEDKIKSREEAIELIYRRLRPGEPPTMKMAMNFFDQLFFNADRYDLSKVGS
jgi:DNA-directed RNA polymerase subunit beta